MAANAPFDRTLLRQRKARAAANLGDHDFLFRLAVNDAFDRASFTTRDFETALCLNACGPLAREALAASRMAKRIGALTTSDLAPALARQAGAPAIAADEEALPFGDGVFDLILAPLCLHWVNDLPGALIQIRRALKPDGLFIGSMFGAGTLAGLRQALTEAELETTGGAGARIAPFADVRDAGALLQRAGFAMPVTDLDRQGVTYADPMRLFADLRGMGETACLTDRPGPLRRASVSRLLEILARYQSEPDGRLAVDFSIITLSGWAPGPDQPTPKRPGSATVRLAEALGVDEKNAGEKAGS